MMIFRFNDRGKDDILDNNQCSVTFLSILVSKDSTFQPSTRHKMPLYDKIPQILIIY